MCEVNSSINCCGIVELADIQNKDSVECLMELGRDVAQGFYNDKGVYINNQTLDPHQDLECAFVIFSDANETGYAYGQPLADLIQKEKLGRVSQVWDKENPNSNNDLTLWVWTPNRKRYIAWFNKQKEAESAPKQPSRPDQENASTNIGLRPFSRL
jgi:hypothetical protein